MDEDLWAAIKRIEAQLAQLKLDLEAVASAPRGCHCGRYPTSQPIYTIPQYTTCNTCK